ncbi:MAG: asparagine synthase (glutamine-hydrolyzing), partial [Planctomycetes bacterium]|nr:asparagine synthase (glutamine-hydrolyzing) [Planctomycetota bacterium]
MCGICGKLNLDIDRPPVTRSAVREMCTPIVHRGPDDEGIYADGIAGIGIRRLSIIDLKTGGQPIHNEDHTIWTVVNGELYNFKEIRRDLESRGHRFYTNSDVEVVPHLYEEYGDDFPSHINGMFGIALWDSRSRKLMLVRDRIGIKPMHYAVESGTLLFGSELKSMLAAGMRRDISPPALSDYLSYNYIPAPNTIFRAARKLEPGQILVAHNATVSLKHYWDLPARADADGLRSEAEYCELIRETLKDSIRRRLMSDVPLGVFLSGGVDSGTIVA